MIAVKIMNMIAEERSRLKKILAKSQSQDPSLHGLMHQVLIQGVKRNL